MRRDDASVLGLVALIHYSDKPCGSFGIKHDNYDTSFIFNNKQMDIMNTTQWFNSSALRSTALGLFLIAVMAIGLVSCSDDPVSPQNLGRSKVTLMHVHPAYTPQIFFYANDTAVTGLTSYGEFKVASSVANGNTKFEARAADNTKLASATKAMDSTSSTFVVFSGEGTASDILITITPRATASAGTALVRFIHASKSSPKVSLRVGDANGSDLATDVDYKGSSATFRSVNTATTKLVVVDDQNNVLHTIDTPNLMDGVAYNVVLYGVEGLTTNLKAQAVIIAEP